MSALVFFAGFALGVVVRVFARLLAPTVSVSVVNGVHLATVTSVFGRDEYVRSSDNSSYTSVWTDDYVRPWRHVRTGRLPSVAMCGRFDGLVRIEECMKPLREGDA